MFIYIYLRHRITTYRLKQKNRYKKPSPSISLARKLQKMDRRSLKMGGGAAPNVSYLLRRNVSHRT